MDERDFELLLKLNETKNITHAADVLYVTQSSLSKRINAIEQELGIRLFIRSRQGIHFTPEGELVLKYISEAAAQLSHMRASLDSQKGYICGTLNAGISINYAMYRLPPLLSDYRGQYPHVDTHIITDKSRNLYFGVLDGSLDVAIIRGEYPWKGNKILLERESICAISLSEMNIAKLTSNQLPYIGRKTDINFERELAQWMHENSIRPQSQGIFVDNITTCVEMVNQGLGWAIVPQICLDNFKGYIQPLHFANGEPFVRSTYLMYSDNLLELPQVKAFVNIVRRQNN